MAFGLMIYFMIGIFFSFGSLMRGIIDAIFSKEELVYKICTFLVLMLLWPIPVIYEILKN